MADEKIAVDLDGVLAKFNKEERKKNKYNLPEYYSSLEKTNFDLPFNCIITSRKARFSDVTFAWLAKERFIVIVNGVSDKNVFIMPDKIPKTRKTIIQYKAETINKLGITKYYEDDKKIAKALHGLCPNVEIKVVKNGRLCD